MNYDWNDSHNIYSNWTHIIKLLQVGIVSLYLQVFTWVNNLKLLFSLNIIFPVLQFPQKACKTKLLRFIQFFIPMASCCISRECLLLSFLVAFLWKVLENSSYHLQCHHLQCNILSCIVTLNACIFLTGSIWKRI